MHPEWRWTPASHPLHPLSLQQLGRSPPAPRQEVQGPSPDIWNVAGWSDIDWSLIRSGLVCWLAGLVSRLCLCLLLGSALSLLFPLLLPAFFHQLSTPVATDGRVDCKQLLKRSQQRAPAPIGQTCVEPFQQVCRDSPLRSLCPKALGNEMPGVLARLCLNRAPARNAQRSSTLHATFLTESAHDA